MNIKTSFVILIFAAIFGFSACLAKPIPESTPLLPTITPISSTPTSQPRDYFLTATIVPFYTQVPSPTVVGQPAIINIALNLGGGGAGFSANIYAQEVYSGKTFTIFMSAGMHSASFLPTSAPLDLAVQAPGTYVIYARLSNDPMDYHFGATECRVPKDCAFGSPLVAIDVLPGEHYSAYIADQKAELPGNDKRGLPVTVPWIK